jgi:hypothetical protein
MELDDVRIEWNDAIMSTAPDGQPPEEMAVLTVGTSVPLNPSARNLWEFGGAPNATFGQLIGPNDRANGIHQRLHAQAPLWKKYERFLHYYLTDRWDLFNTTGTQLYEDDWREPKSIQARHIAALHPAYLLLLPIIPSERGAALFRSTVAGLPNVVEMPSFVAWACSTEAADTVSDIQGALFEQLRAFVRIWESWGPVLVVRWTEPSKKPLLEQLRVYRDDFEVLRDAYVQTYETCCRALPLAMALMNADVRGDPNTFGPVPLKILQGNAKAKAPTSLSAYSDLPNANKIHWLQDWPAWRTQLPALLNKEIRNAIGHASARY